MRLVLPGFLRTTFPEVPVPFFNRLLAQPSHFEDWIRVGGGKNAVLTPKVCTTRVAAPSSAFPSSGIRGDEPARLRSQLLDLPENEV